MKALGKRPSNGALHRARIRAKRARYAAELAQPVAEPNQLFGIEWRFGFGVVADNLMNIATFAKAKAVVGACGTVTSLHPRSVEIKVDRRFVAGCADDRAKRAICQRILDGLPPDDSWPSISP